MCICQNKNPHLTLRVAAIAHTPRQIIRMDIYIPSFVCESCVRQLYTQHSLSLVIERRAHNRECILTQLNIFCAAIVQDVISSKVGVRVEKFVL